MKFILNRKLAVAFFLSHWVLGANLCFAQQSINAIRAAYLWYFSSLIQWPNDVDFNEDSFTLCAATSDKKDIFQLSTINNKKVSGYNLNIVLPFAERSGFESISSCHLIYISGSVSELIDKHVEKINNGALVVSEGYHSDLTHIELVHDNNKLKFSVNRTKLNKRGFKVSSKLLRLSRNRQ